MSGGTAIRARMTEKFNAALAPIVFPAERSQKEALYTSLLEQFNEICRKVQKRFESFGTVPVSYTHLVTVAAMFDTAHPKKSGKCPVKIRVTYNRVRNYYPTGKDLSPEEWEILPTTKVRALVAIRKDIESSYQIVRAAVEELAGAGAFTLLSLIHI